VGTDDKINPVEQKPPDLVELAKNYLWAFLRRTFGPRVAVIIFLTIAAALYFHSEIAVIVSDVHAQVVQWWPLPKANSAIFTVAIARLEDDDKKTNIEPMLAQDLKELTGIAVLEFPRTITADSANEIQADRAKAREWLKQSGAQVLIWGKVLTAGGRSVPQLYWTTSEGATPKKPSDRYGLDENLRLPSVFLSDLSDILHLLVVTQSSAFNAEEGHFLADRLRPFIERVRRLLEGEAVKNWTAEDIARTKSILANALVTVGEQGGDNKSLSEAIHLYKESSLSGFTRQQHPLDWARVQYHLGTALRALGERESDTQHLNDAVAAFRASLEERTRVRGPLDWAATQNGLGNALRSLGERESGTQHLTEAVTAYRAALEEWTRGRVPLYWAGTQNNLGSALWALGERESGTEHLTEAMTAYRAALEEWTRGRVPLYWAGTQNNLGNALTDLGERESGTQHLTEAVTAYRAALEELPPGHVPFNWAVTQTGLGNALRVLGNRTHNVKQLCLALGDHVSAWQVFSEEASPNYAFSAAVDAKLDVNAIHDQSLGTAPPCLQTYSVDLKQMGVQN